MTDTKTTVTAENQAAQFKLPSSWEAMPYGEHWSFAYTTERGEREDYDFRIEFNEGVGGVEERAVIGLLEVAPELLEALIDVLPYATTCIGLPRSSWPSDSVILKAEAAIAKATGAA